MRGNLHNNKWIQQLLLRQQEKYMMINIFEDDRPRNIKVNGHYVVPLLLKSNDVNLPGNRVLALKWLNCFQRRFLKDEHFYEIYKTMQIWLQKDMLRKQATIANQGKDVTYHNTPWGYIECIPLPSKIRLKKYGFWCYIWKAKGWGGLTFQRSRGELNYQRGG